MNRFVASLLFLMSLAVAEAVPASPSKDVAAWPGLHWGADEPAIAKAVPEATRLPDAWEFGPLEAGFLIRERHVGGVPFRVIFQTDRLTGGLRQVLFENRRHIGSSAAIEGVIEALEAELGAPHFVCRAESRPDVRHVELRWRTPDTIVHASFLDFLTTGVITRDPSRDIDPLKTWREQRVLNWRFLPRRMTIRYHPAEDAALAPAAGCVEVAEAGRP